tara:strand:+ start:2215 stop:2517 length:303 start_codon:yes stop_codon:yes gene_type:complete
MTEENNTEGTGLDIENLQDGLLQTRWADLLENEDFASWWQVARERSDHSKENMLKYFGPEPLPVYREEIARMCANGIMDTYVLMKVVEGLIYRIEKMEGK